MNEQNARIKSTQYMDDCSTEFAKAALYVDEWNNQMIPELQNTFENQKEQLINLWDTFSTALVYAGMLVDEPEDMELRQRLDHFMMEGKRNIELLLQKSGEIVGQQERFYEKISQQVQKLRRASEKIPSDTAEDSTILLYEKRYEHLASEMENLRSYLYITGSAYKKAQPCLKSISGEMDLARRNFSKNNWKRVRNNLDKAIVKSCKAQDMIGKQKVHKWNRQGRWAG